jgi:hypothetical protein
LLNGTPRKIYIDGSAAIANAMFVRLDREFGPSSTYQEIAERIRADEADVFNILGIEEDLT